MPGFKSDLVIELSDKAWTAKASFDTLIAECYEHALPGRNPYFGTGNGQPAGKAGVKGGDKSSRRVFDSTLQNDATKLANRIQYELFPIGHHWADMEPGTFVPDEAQEQARSELQKLKEVLFTAISFSNFDLAIAEWLLELVVAGTACMFVTDGDEDNPVVYQAVTQAHVALRDGAYGKVDLISRKHKMRCSLVAQVWSDADAIPCKDGEDPEVNLIDVCYYDAKDRIWFYDVIVTGGLDQDGTTRILRREYETCPWIVARWNKAAEEAQGRSIVMQALPDARVLSAVKSYLLRHAALAIGGTYLVKNDGTVNASTVKIFPGATIPVRSTGGPAGASVAPLPVGGDVNLADLVIRDLVSSIHQIMMNDGMPDVADGVRTATELIERMKELQQSLGAPFARILKEGIIPMLEATIDVLVRAGVVPDSGRKIKLNNGEITVKFSSPLVQGQALREVEAARQAMAITAEAAGEQAVQLNFMIEDFGAWVAGRLGVVPAMVRPRQQREELQKVAGSAMAAGQDPMVGGTGGVMPPQQQQNANPVPLAA